MTHDLDGYEHTDNLHLYAGQRIWLKAEITGGGTFFLRNGGEERTLDMSDVQTLDGVLVSSFEEIVATKALQVVREQSLRYIKFKATITPVKLESYHERQYYRLSRITNVMNNDL